MIEALGAAWRPARDRLADVELIAATDVEHPLLGPMGAARVFGPQKGADPDTVLVLERRLTEWAAELDAAAGRPVSEREGRRRRGRPRRRRCWRSAAAASPAPRSSPSTPTSPTTSPRPSSSSPVRGGSTTSRCTAKWSARCAGAARGTPVLVLAGQVTLDDAALRDAGIDGRLRHRRPRRIRPAGHLRRRQPADRVGGGHGRRNSGIAA